MRISTIAPDGDTLRLYYGAADTTAALATSAILTRVDWLTGFLKQKERSMNGSENRVHQQLL